jgi:hypothetical protein
MDKDKVAAGLAWLRELAEGEPIGDVPPLAVLAATVDAGTLGLASFDEQRDANTPLPPSIAVPLRMPIVKTASGGELIKTITFRPPTWAEFKRWQRKAAKAKTLDERGLELGDLAVVELNTCDLEQPDIDRLSAIDAQRCVEALAPFLALQAR